MHTRTELEPWQTEVQADIGTESRQREETRGWGAQMSNDERNQWLSSVPAQPHPWASSVQALQDGNDGSDSPPAPTDRWAGAPTPPGQQGPSQAITGGIHVFPAPQRYSSTPWTVEQVRAEWLAGGGWQTEAEQQLRAARATNRNATDLRLMEHVPIPRLPQNRRFRGWDRAAVEIHESWDRQQAQLAHRNSDPERALGWDVGCGCHDCHREDDGWCDCRLEINNPDDPER